MLLKCMNHTHKHTIAHIHLAKENIKSHVLKDVAMIRYFNFVKRCYVLLSDVQWILIRLLYSLFV